MLSEKRYRLPMQFRLPAFFLGLLFSISLNAQSVEINGRVIDYDTDEGLPFCNIFIKGTTTGVSSDIDGYYTLNLDNPADSITVSAIGYKDQSKPITSSTVQTIDFKMRASNVSLVEVVVIAGENPANAIVRGIIKNKPINDVSNLPSYECENYTKMELDIDKFDLITNRKILTQFDFVFDNVDSISDEVPFLPAFLTETIYDVYYVKGEPLKEIPKAMKVSGVNNQSIVDFVNKFQEKYNVYDNWVNIVGKTLVSPFANSGLQYYEYYILDSMLIDGYKSYKLKFKPKRKQENTFYGDFWVADSVFAVQRVNMRMSEDVNINYVSRVIIYDEFNLHNDSLWLPAKSKMVIDFDAIGNAPGVIGRRTTMFKDYKVNSQQTPDAYKKVDPEDYRLDKLERSDEFWDGSRHETLADNEMGIYDMIDSIQKVPIYKTYSSLFYTLGSGWILAGPIEFGRYYEIYSSNQVEGSRLRMAVGTSNKWSKILRLEGNIAYGFKDKRFKYGGNFQWNIRKGIRRTMLSGYYLDAVSYTNNSSEEVNTASVLSSFYRSQPRDSAGNKQIFEKLLHMNEVKLRLEHDWKRGWSNRVTLLHRRMDPYSRTGSGLDFKYLPNPVDPLRVDTTVTSLELVLNTRFAFKETILQGEFDRISVGSKYPIVNLQFTMGVPGILGSAYRYQKIVLGVDHYFYINPFGWFEYEFKAGAVFGQLPYLLLETHPGNETFVFGQTSFNAMNRFEFVSDKYASLMVQHHLDGWFFNHIPLIRKLEWRLVGHFNTVVGSLSDRNRDANRLNFADYGKTVGLRAPGPVPYMESGIGIENIFKVFRVDAVWRLNYFDNPDAQLFSVRGSLDFNF